MSTKNNFNVAICKILKTYCGINVILTWTKNSTKTKMTNINKVWELYAIFYKMFE